MNSGEYKVVYNGASVSNQSSISFIVRFGVGNIPSPVVKSAKFDATGTKINIAFLESVQILYSSFFPCNNVFFFRKSSDYKCIFLSSLQIDVILLGNATINVGDLITVLGGKFKGCNQVNTSACNHNIVQKNDFKIQITAPTIPLLPFVNIRGRSSFSFCDVSLLLDVSDSSGSGGREWLSVVWTVVGANGSFNTMIADFMNFKLKWFHCHYGDLDCNAIPISLFKTEFGVFSFYLTLTNFLNVSSTSSFSVRYFSEMLLSPVVTLFGPVNNNFHSIYGGSILANIMFSQSCLSLINVSGTKFNMNYVWHVFTEDSLGLLSPADYVIDIDSDKKKFTFEKYALNPGVTYIFQFTAFYMFNAKVISTIAKCNLYVPLVGSVVALLDGGSSMRTIGYGSKIELSAAMSYDDNNRSSILTFNWACWTLAPRIKSSCGGFDNLGEKKSPFLSFSSTLLSVNGTFSFVVYVKNPITLQSNSASVQIQIAPAIVPKAIIFPSVIDKVFTSQSYFTITAETSFAINSSYSAIFSIPSLGLFFLGQRTFTSGNMMNIITLQSSVLTPLLSVDRSLTLQLRLIPASCVFWTKCVSMAVYEINIQTNSPPSSGIFIVSPVSGGILTTFNLQAQFWVDVDLPLNYAYSQLDTTRASYVLLGPNSKMNYAYSYLSPNNDNNSTIVLKAIVSDSFGASSYCYQHVTLTVFAKSIQRHLSLGDNPTLLTSMVLLLDNYVDLDDINHVLQLTSSITSYLTVSNLLGVNCSSTLHYLVNISTYCVAAIDADAFTLNIFINSLSRNVIATERCLNNNVGGELPFLLLNALGIQSQSVFVALNTIGAIDYTTLGGFSQYVVSLGKMRSFYESFVGVSRQQFRGPLLIIDLDFSFLQMTITNNLVISFMDVMFAALPLGESWYYVDEFVSAQMLKGWAIVDRNVTLPNMVILSDILHHAVAYGYLSIVSKDSIASCLFPACYQSSSTILTRLSISTFRNLSKQSDFQTIVLPDIADASSLLAFSNVPVTHSGVCTTAGVAVEVSCPAIETHGPPSVVVVPCETSGHLWNVSCPIFGYQQNCSSAINGQICRITKRSNNATYCYCSSQYEIVVQESVLPGVPTFVTSYSATASFDEILLTDSSIAINKFSVVGASTNITTVLFVVRFAAAFCFCAILLILYKLFVRRSKYITESKWHNANISPHKIFGTSKENKSSPSSETTVIMRLKEVPLQVKIPFLEFKPKLFADSDVITLQTIDVINNHNQVNEVHLKPNPEDKSCVVSRSQYAQKKNYDKDLLSKLHNSNDLLKQIDVDLIADDDEFIKALKNVQEFNLSKIHSVVKAKAKGLSNLALVDDISLSKIMERKYKLHNDVDKTLVFGNDEDGCLAVT